MANVASVTDGTTTIGLSSGGCILTHYMPKAPEGGALMVTETIEFLIAEATVAATQAKLAAIEQVLLSARMAQRGLTPRVYLLFQAGADATAARSEIIDYRLELGEDAATGLFQQRLECRLLVTRRFYWEGAEVEVQLSTSNQAAATGGRTIRNHDDGGTGDDNWVQIAGGQVTGVLPAACRIQIQNAIGAGRQFTKFYVALNALSDPANFVHIIEGESRLSGGSVDSNAAYSNGQGLYVVLWGATPTSATFLWTLPASLLQRAAGRPFRLLARFVTGIGVTTARAEVRAADGAATLWRGDTVDMPGLYGGLLDLGVAPLPPGGYSASYGALTLAMTLTGIGQRYLDFIQLTPMDSLTMLECAALVGQGESLVLDSAERRQYIVSGAAQLPYVAASGGEILLHPGRTQRLIFLEENTAGTNRGEAGDAFVVRVWVRPRRVTV